MITIYNGDKLTRQPFFGQLISFLYQHPNANLRQIRSFFVAESQLDRKLDNYIQAGYIVREDRQYRLGFDVFDDSLPLPKDHPGKPCQLIYEAPVFVLTSSRLRATLDETTIQQVLGNQTNSLVWHFSSNFVRTTDNWVNYFDHVAQGLPLSDVERQVYQLIGDVDPEYALKYMTTFLLKFSKKETVLQKRPDVFVQSLAVFGYIRPLDDAQTQFGLTIELRDKAEELPTKTYTDAKTFIQMQLTQQQKNKPYITLGL